MPRKQLVAFVQVLALAVRCLHVDVTSGQGSAGDQPHTCRQEPHWQAAALCASISSSSSAQHLRPRGYRRSTEIGRGLAFRELEPNRRGWIWLPLLTVACTACRLGKCNFCSSRYPKALPLVKCLHYSLIKKDTDLGDSSLNKRIRTVMGM